MSVTLMRIYSNSPMAIGHFRDLGQVGNPENDIGFPFISIYDAPTPPEDTFWNSVNQPTLPEWSEPDDPKCLTKQIADSIGYDFRVRPPMWLLNGFTVLAHEAQARFVYYRADVAWGDYDCQLAVLIDSEAISRFVRDLEGDIWKVDQDCIARVSVDSIDFVVRRFLASGSTA